MISVDRKDISSNPTNWFTCVPRGIFNVVTEIWNGVLHSNPIHFDRGVGYWSDPSDEKNQSFFSKITNRKSQRENWYKVTPYIAEFWCTLSNAGFFYVGVRHASPELIFAGTASVVSHTIPKEWLLVVDKIGAASAILRLAMEYETLMKYPWLLTPIAAVGLINLCDSYSARTRGYTLPHVVWHLSSAGVADLVLTYSKK